MNKFLKALLMAPIVLAALVFLVGYLLPSQWQVSRSWISDKMGNGSQTITTADTRTGVHFELKMENTKFGLNGNIGFEPTGSGTKVTWTDSGDTGNNIFFRYMASMMDKMMGNTFERSLAKLKEKAETVTVK